MFRTNIFGRNISFKHLVFILTLASLSACGGGGSGDETLVITQNGIFVDVVVSGLDYQRYAAWGQSECDLL